MIIDVVKKLLKEEDECLLTICIRTDAERTHPLVRLCT